jgi:IS30 family transposase
MAGLSTPFPFANDLRKPKTEPFLVIGKAICCAVKRTAIWRRSLERHSRFLVLIKVPGKDTAVVVAALSKHVRKLPETLRRSLTWDRGLEMAKDKEFTMATDVQVYFCDPQSPWQRGTNENTNLLLRQYFP